MFKNSNDSQFINTEFNNTDEYNKLFTCLLHLKNT